MKNKFCKQCNKFFKPRSDKSKFCGYSCAAKNRTGNKNGNWRGGIQHSDGYKYIYQPTHPGATKMGYVLEHRLMMERKLGRQLRKDEIIHHINHDKSDNRLCNLFILTSTGKHFISKHFNARDHKGRFISQPRFWGCPDRPRPR